MNTETVTAYVSLGSNLGDRAGNLLLAVRGLHEAHLCVNRMSAVYETEPFGVAEHPAYLNMVVEVHVTNITPEQMMARMLRIEYLLGRRRDADGEKTPRTVDLDLLLFGDLQHQTDFLIVPHPRMHLRNFVIVPLVEIAPHVVHPALKKTARQLQKQLKDKYAVHRWQPHTDLEFETLKAKSIAS